MAKHVSRNGLSPNPRLRCTFMSKHVAENSNTYVLNTALNNHSNSLLAVALSNNTILVYSGFNFDSSDVLQGHKKQVTGLKFSKDNANILLSSSLDGNVYVWDTRCKAIPVQTFLDETGDIVKPLCSFDFNIDERVICAGTEIIREDSFLVFWDRRNSKNLGGYWNCHTDDITQVSFHPSQLATMASGSVDGLINLFDLNNSCEDESLLQTLNTGSSVSKLKWVDGYSPDLTTDYLSCITHIEEYQLWSRNEAHPVLSYERESLCKTDKCNVDYFVDSFTLDKDIYLASGTNNGHIHLWELDDGGPHLVTSLENEHTDIVRTLSWSVLNNLLVSGGEDGLICLWKCFSNKATTT